MKTDSFGIRVPVRDVGTILYFYHREIGSHGLTVGSCLRDVVSQAAANIRAERPEMNIDEEQAAEIIARLKGTSPGKNFGFSVPKPASPSAPDIDPAAILEAAREVSEKEKPRTPPQFEADIIDD